MANHHRPSASAALAQALALGLAGGAAAAPDRAAAAPDQAAAPYASASGPRVAIMRFDGREANIPPARPLTPEAAASCVYGYFQELRQRDPRGLRYEVLSPDRWHEARRRGRAPDVQRTAEALQADLVIGGWLEQAREGRAPFKMTLALYSNWADPLGQVTVDLWSRECDTRMLGRGAQPFLALINQALGLGAAAPPPGNPPPKAPPPAAPAKDPPDGKDGREARDGKEPREPARPRKDERRDDGPVTQADDREAAPVAGGGLVPAARGAEDYLRRPPWRELLSLQAGYLFGWRRFTDSNNTGFNVAGSTTGLPGAHGVAFQAEVYPLAAARVPLAAAGLGMRLSALLPFWPAVVQKDGAGNRVGSYSTSELRIDWGFLRWHWNISDSILRPELLAEALYGYHRFEFSRQENSNVVLPLPTVGYQYVGGSLGLRMHFPYRVAAQVGLTLAGLLDLGPMGLQGSEKPGAELGFLVYGPGSGLLLRFDAGVVVPLYKGLGVAASGFYERTGLSFEGKGDVLDANKLPVMSATDEYAGIMAGLRYWY